MIARAKRARDRGRGVETSLKAPNTTLIHRFLNPPRHTPGHTLGDRNITVREDKAPTKSAPSKSGGNRSTIGDTPAADGCRCYVGNLAWETNEESLIGEFQPDTPNRADSGRFRATHRAGRARSARFLTSESLPSPSWIESNSPFGNS